MIDYRISYRLGSNSYTTLASGITLTSYSATSLTPDGIYTFRVESRTLVGYSGFSIELAVRAAARPSMPSSPTTSLISNTNVVITWVAPFNGGSQITSYRITIRQNDLTYTTELASCNGSSQSVIAALSCTLPISTLQASPFNLLWGASVYAKVIATNVVNSSDISLEGNGAVIVTNPDPPVSLTNIASVTSATRIGISWSAGVSNGGTQVLDYRISWDQGASNYVPLATGISAL